MVYAYLPFKWFGLIFILHVCIISHQLYFCKLHNQTMYCLAQAVFCCNSKNKNGAQITSADNGCSTQIGACLTVVIKILDF